jgi:ABC-type nitrate/sulfonate/bicarbonate transport system substrate-binding protein
MLDRAIQPSGLTTQDVEFKLMPYPDMLVALANRSIEGAMELVLPGGDSPWVQMVSGRPL